jgi:hypothetical protein
MSADKKRERNGGSGAFILTAAPCIETGFLLRPGRSVEKTNTLRIQTHKF